MIFFLTDTAENTQKTDGSLNITDCLSDTADFATKDSVEALELITLRESHKNTAISSLGELDSTMLAGKEPLADCSLDVHSLRCPFLSLKKKRSTFLSTFYLSAVKSI